MPLLDLDRPCQTKDGYPAHYVGEAPNGLLVFFVDKSVRTDPSLILTNPWGHKQYGGLPALWDVENVPAPDQTQVLHVFNDDHSSAGRIEVVIDGATGMIKDTKIL